MNGAQRVFVYGTLRRHGNHHHLLGKARFLGDYVTPPGYTMVDLGDYPAVVAGGRYQVTGEVYRITQRVLARLDEYEDYPREYTRRKIATAYGPSWIYLRVRPGIVSGYTRRLVKTGNWLAGRQG